MLDKVILNMLSPLNIIVCLQETETGLYVCLNTFLGFGKRYVEKYFRKTGNGVFLHIRRTRKEVGGDKINFCMSKPFFGVPTRSDTNQPVQSQKKARSLKFRI